MTEERIGRYRVTGVIGVGGFATVLRAVDERLEDEVAVKVLAENRALDPEVRARFLAEGRVLRRIDSAHVVRVLELDETDRQQPYLVLELADRGDVAARVAGLRRTGWRAGPDDVRALVEPLTDAVAAVHRAGIVHRDLSPSNVLLRSTLAPDAGADASEVLAADERLLLADLGLSKDLARSSGLTVAGGTDGFRPPEQRGELAVIDPRADLWALSALVVWLVAGAAPEDADHARTLLRGGALVDGAVDVIVRGLADDPTRRQADVDTWRAELLAALRPPVTAPATAGTSAPGARRGVAPAVVAAVAVAALLLGAAGTAVVSTVSGGPAVTVEDDEVTVTATDGDLVATLTGPAAVTSGADAVFTAEVRGGVSAVWIAPDGVVHDAAEALTVTTRSPGGATVSLVATAPGGREARASHRLDVIGP